MLIEVVEKDPLRKRTMRLSLRTALIALNYEKKNPHFNFSKWACSAINEKYGPEYETKRGLTRKEAKLFNRLKEYRASRNNRVGSNS